ncbi:MAG TPA: hypothetical protein VJR93_02975 [Chthoniobacterales bacterium]|nr:hypothetical protein [Chthoniobacterales bacterium]
MPSAELPFSAATCVEPHCETGLPDAPRSWRQTWRDHAYILPSIFLSLIVCAWFVTWGDWRFFDPENFCGFYDAQALSMIDGRFDVPPEAIGNEAFIFHGKAYGYFGVGPALLRLPLIVVFQKMDGRWSRMMMLVGCGINLLCAYRILRLIRSNDNVTTPAQRLLHSFFILCVGIGSTNVFLAGRSFTYHEAIMWGGAFSLLFTLMILKYLTQPRCRWLLLAGFFAFMSLHCRPTVGAGALLGICLISVILAWRSLTKSQATQSLLGFTAVAAGRHGLIAAAVVVITLATYFGINYAKFRTFNGIPLQYYAWYNAVPIRMKITGGKQINPKNIPTGLATYFGPNGMSFDHQFPWILLSHQPIALGSPTTEMVEGFSSVPVSMPALALLGTFGCVALVRGSSVFVRRMRLPVLTLLLGGGIVLGCVDITERYLHDFYPGLILCAAVGLSRLETKEKLWRPAVLIAALTIMSIVVNCSFSFVHQRTGYDAPRSKLAEYTCLQETVARLLHGRR